MSSTIKNIEKHLRFKDWTMPNPIHPSMCAALRNARYDKAGLSDSDIWLLLSAAESYIHFAAHPATTESIIRQLRQLRRAVRS